MSWKRTKYLSEKVWHLLNILMTCVTGLISIIIIIELSVSYLYNFCSGWLTVCNFGQIDHICGYFTNITYNNDTGIYDFIETKEVCYGVWTISTYSFLICLIILISELIVIFGRFQISLNYMIGQTMANLLNFLSFFYISIASQLGLNHFCNQLAIPKCSSPSLYVAGLNNCRLTNDALPQCYEVTNTLSFVGRYKVISGVAWWGFINSLGILIFTVIQLKMTTNKKQTTKKKVVFKVPPNAPKIYVYGDYNEARI